jgi:predicted  nucleic acid-binding Zn-ribbon protein
MHLTQGANKLMEDNRKSLKTVINNLSVQIDDMQRKAAQVSDDARDEYKRHIKSLQEQKRQAEKRLFALEDSGSGAVEDIKSSLQHAWNGVKETVSGAVERLR